MRELLVALAIPRMFIVGDRGEPLDGRESLEAACVRVVELAGSGHLMMDDQPDAFARAIAEALARGGPRPRDGSRALALREEPPVRDEKPTEYKRETAKIELPAPAATAVQKLDQKHERRAPRDVPGPTLASPKWPRSYSHQEHAEGEHEVPQLA